MAKSTKPGLDISKARNRAREANAVIENVMQSMIGAIRRDLKRNAAGKPTTPPTGKGYAQILLADLRVRGFDLIETRLANPRDEGKST